MNDPADLGVLEATSLLGRRQLSAAELAEACLRRIEERNGGPPSFDGEPTAINAWARIYPELARSCARAADERLAREGADAPRLCGVPLAVKDLYGIAGLPLTASSGVLHDHVAPVDAAVWVRLREQGMVPLGHTHTHEFGAGGTTDQVGNPWSLERVAGGSSGGNAAALAARMVPAALGTDTCGSLRIPSACCGTSALKPTHGRLPLDGTIPLAPSLDHPGPMARTIADCAALLGAMTDDRPVAARPRGLAGLTVAVTDRTSEVALDEAVEAGLRVAREACQSLGARVRSLPAPGRLNWDDLSTVLLTEVWAHHAQYADRHERYRPAIAEFVEAASGFTDAQKYREAQQRRARGAEAWERWFSAQGVDLVLEPTLPIVPYARGPGYDRGHAGGAGDPFIALTALWDMTGMPVASLPVTSTVGISLIAPREHEAPLIRAAIDLQEHALGVPVWQP